VIHGKTTKNPHEKESREKKSRIIGGALMSGTPRAVQQFQEYSVEQVHEIDDNYPLDLERARRRPDSDDRR
jgi:hypothetical protein